MTQGPTAKIAEIVTFRLKDGTDPDTFTADARATEALLRKTPGYVRRHLSQGSDGQWTDIVLWGSMEAALSAAEEVVNHPDFAPFGSAIDGASVAMRHEQIEILME